MAIVRLKWRLENNMSQPKNISDGICDAGGMFSSDNGTVWSFICRHGDSDPLNARGGSVDHSFAFAEGAGECVIKDSVRLRPD
ncbi:MAG: hypothetical protein ACP5I8_09405 [Phycisphaerae bacterium]